MIKVVAIADSLAMPRNEGVDVVLWEQTWPYLLERHLRKIDPDSLVVNKGMRARTINTLVGDDFYESVRYIAPQIAVVQVGIVDCMPRVFSRREQALLSSRFMPNAIKNRLIKHRSEHRASLVSVDPLKKVYTSLNDFSKYQCAFLDMVLSYNPNLIVFFIPVVANTTQMDKKSPGSRSNIDIYNQAMIQNVLTRKNAQIVDLSGTAFQLENNANLFCTDGYHLNPEGNVVVSEVLMQSIQRYLNK